MSGTPLNRVNLNEEPQLIEQMPTGFNAFVIGTDDEGHKTVALAKQSAIANDDLNDDMPILPLWMHEKLSGRR